MVAVVNAHVSGKQAVSSRVHLHIPSKHACMQGEAFYSTETKFAAGTASVYFTFVT